MSTPLDVAHHDDRDAHEAQFTRRPQCSSARRVLAVQPILSADDENTPAPGN
jgi:hypothetical protein